MSAPDPYDLGARAVAATIYRGRRDIAGDRVGWDQLTDSDKAACLALARPVVDAVATLNPGLSVAADKEGES